MARVKLTAGRVSGFSSDSGQSFLWDTEVKGLAVRAVAGSEKKAFIWQDKLSGKTIRITIGDVSTWGIDDARSRAREFHVMADKGVDPRMAKADVIAQQDSRREKEVKAKSTIHDAFKAYIEDRKSCWGVSRVKQHEKYMDPGGKPYGRGKHADWGETTRPGALHSLMSFPLSGLSAEVIGAWLKKDSARAPGMTAVAFRDFRAFLNWCAEQSEYDTIDPQACLPKRVREVVTRGRARDDCLQREQLETWFDSVRHISNPVVSNYLQALLLTGARRNELAALRWVDVDFQWASMTIRDKVEGERTIPLTPYVSALLSALPRRNEWVFSSTGRRGMEPGDKEISPGHIVSPTKAHSHAVMLAGLPHIALHGLRRSFGTLAEWVEVPVGVVAQIMGHKPSAIAEKHYRVRPLDLLRMWHEKIEAWILSEAGIEFDTSAASKGKKVLRVVSAA